jgi:uncharacterized membrane protein YqaE (UPF0057 family)
MRILRLIISILFPPIGLFLNYMLGTEDRLEKAAMIISTVLSIGIVLFIIIVIAMVNANNKQEEDLLRCRNPYYCEPSNGEYQTCYYCKDKICKDLGKITCVNDTESDPFNYSTIADPNDE